MISLAEDAASIRSCYPVMAQLRPQFEEQSFLNQVQKQILQGFNLAYLTNEGSVVAVAGFRFGENLAWGKYLYIDDLVTDQKARSHGFGSRLLQWLFSCARQHDCDQVHLDSGNQRTEAHRFYLTEGMTQTSLHFRLSL